MWEGKINVGDIVHITFKNGEHLTDMEVIYVPSQPGDTWTVTDQDRTLLHVIKDFESITRRNPFK